MVSTGGKKQCYSSLACQGDRHEAPSESPPLTATLFCTLFFLAAWILLCNGGNGHPWYSNKTRSSAPLPKDPLERATALLERFPFIDGMSSQRTP